MRRWMRWTAICAGAAAAATPLAFGAVVDEAPTSTIGGNLTSISNPHGVAVDSSGRMYLANQGGVVNVYQWANSGNVARTAGVPNPAGTNTPLGVFVNSDDHVWVAYNSGHVAEFGPNPGNGSTPLRVINAGEAGAYNSIRGVVLDRDGYIYTADCDSGIIKVFAPDAVGAATPVRDLRGPVTRLGPSYGLAGGSGSGQSWGLDIAGDGSLVVAGGTRVLRFAPGATGNVAPVSAIDTAPAFSYAIEVEVVASGNIYVADRSAKSVSIFPPTALDSATDVDTPLQVITGASTLLASPVGLAVDTTTGTIVVGDNAGDTGIRRYAPFEAGGRPGSLPPVAPVVDAPAPGATTTPAVAPERPRTGVSIDCGSRFTETPAVTLCIQPPEGAERMVIANDGGFDEARVLPVAARQKWTLDSTGPTRLPKTVYVRFEGPGVNKEITYTDDIILDETRPEVLDASVVPAPVGESARGSRPRQALLRVRARDSQSAVSRMRVAVGGRALPPTEFRGVARIPAGQGPVRVRVRDRAGNWSRWQAAVGVG